MTDAITTVLSGLNAAATPLGAALAPVGWLPAWLSLALVSVLTGIVMLIAFKWTSNQRAIKRVRRGIRANMLAARLFKDNMRAGLIAQAGVFAGAFRLLLLALVPMLVMAVPMVLLLAQLGTWYQTAPLPVGQEAVVTVALGGDPASPMPAVELQPDDDFEDVSGPVRVFSRREVCWSLRPTKPGTHRLRFRVGEEVFEKDLTAGIGVMRVSPLRPSRDWEDVLLYPSERPFDAASAVQSIKIEHPSRAGRFTGSGNWVISWFAVSLVAGFLLRGIFKVNF